MLPAVAKKIDKMSSGGSKKQEKTSKKLKKSSKKSKKHKKNKKKRHTNDGDSSSEEERIVKKKKKHYSDSENTSTSGDSDSEDEWVEKKTVVDSKAKREPDDWMGGMMLPTYSKNAVESKAFKNEDKRKDIDSYDPAKSVRELNPYWKDGGQGLPSFQKPINDSNDEDDANDGNAKRMHIRQSRQVSVRQSNWRKNTKAENLPTKMQTRSSSSSNSSRSSSPEDTKEPETQPASVQTSRSEFLTDQQMNELGAKILKAEILGDDEMVEELRTKLERARQYRVEHKELFLAKSLERRQNLNSTKNKRNDDQEGIVLTSSNSKGLSRPVTKLHSENDLWGGASGRKTKKQKVETHSAGERVRYFADDDKYDIKQMVSD